MDEWLSERYDDPDAIKPSIHFLSERVEGTKINCPNCGSMYVYTDKHRLESDMVSCQNCGSMIEEVGEAVLIVKEPTGAPTPTENWAECAILILLLLFLPLQFAVPIVLCYAIYKVSQSREQTYFDSKVVSRNAEGPGPG
jgi:predicted RNA-binding Zn-ribbon protein involved in translation (DUF1610 family)